MPIREIPTGQNKADPFYAPARGPSYISSNGVVFSVAIACVVYYDTIEGAMGEHFLR